MSLVSAADRLHHEMRRVGGQRGQLIPRSFAGGDNPMRCLGGALLA